MSQINENNIDGNYPIAGQDNDSQGFRDNFTNTRNNLRIARTELEDLQAKVLLKSPLTGDLETDADYNNLNATVLNAAKMKSMRSLVVTKQNTSAFDIDFTEANSFVLNVETDATLTLSNFPNESHNTIKVLVVTDAPRALAVTGIAFENIDSIPGYDAVSEEIDFPAAGEWLFEINQFGDKFYINNTSQNRSDNTATIKPRSSEPANAASGMMAVDDGTDWSGVATGAGVETLVIYLNGGWVKVA